MQKGKTSSSQIVKITILFVFLLYIAWIGAWILEKTLEQNFTSMTTSESQFFYWLAMKILLWVIPAIVVIRYSGRTVAEVMGIKRFRSILLWGVVVGLILGAITILLKVFGHQSILSIESTWSFIGGIIVAPIVEEITFRGAVLGGLTQHYRFAIANILTAIFFLGAHMPGWYFQKTLVTNLMSPVDGAISIFILGLIFGYVAQKSKSVSASIVTHILNNLFNV